MASASKTARRSAPVGGKMTDEQRVKEAARAQSARIIPLAGGTLCYFREPVSGSLLKIDPRSEGFIETIRPGCEMGMSERIRSELTELAAAYPNAPWGSVLAKVEESGVLVDA